ncbi:MAG: hypothetical protein ABH952_02880 [Candidatus Omnitrophota bacterium]
MGLGNNTGRTEVEPFSLVLAEIRQKIEAGELPERGIQARRLNKSPGYVVRIGEGITNKEALNSSRLKSILEWIAEYKQQVYVVIEGNPQELKKTLGKLEKVNDGKRLFVIQHIGNELIVIPQGGAAPKTA